jgi:hypothetical protein
MPVTITNTPNPNALKFTVGVPVGGPATFTAASDDADPVARDVLAVEGVVSMFMTADFVTVTKGPEGDWAAIAPAVQAILEAAY